MFGGEVSAVEHELRVSADIRAEKCGADAGRRPNVKFEENWMRMLTIRKGRFMFPVVYNVIAVS